MVEQEAEGVDVGRRLRRAAGPLLRRQVGGGTQDRPVPLPHRGRDPEVDDLDPAAPGQHHVGRSHVPVHQPLRVRGGQRRGDLGGHPHGAAPRQRPGADAVRQRLPVDQLHHHIGGTVAALAVVVHVGDVRVGQAGGRACLPAHPAAQLRIGDQLGRQELHRDRPPEHLVVPAPHHRHPAGAEPLDEPVPASNRVHNVISVPYPDNGSVSATPERQV